MKASFAHYNHILSANRIVEILNAGDISYRDADSIPSRDSLTFTNGFYVNCSAMFVDIRGSSELAEKYKRPTLARIYRCYVSEAVAVMRDHKKVREVGIQGDCVWGIFDTPKNADVDELFSVAAKVSSMVDILNWRFEQKSLDPLTVGIGLSYGRVLMVKAGYRGSLINDVVWMGDVVNESSKLCEWANSSGSDKEIMVSRVIYDRLQEQYQSYLEWNYLKGCYHGDVIHNEMAQWLRKRRTR